MGILCWRPDELSPFATNSSQSTLFAGNPVRPMICSANMKMPCSRIQASESNIVVPIVGMIRIAIRRTHIVSVVDPTNTAQHPVSTTSQLFSIVSIQNCKRILLARPFATPMHWRVLTKQR